MMEAVVLEPRTKSEARFVLDFAKRTGISARIFDPEEVEDRVMVALIEEGMKTQSVSRDEIMNALKR